MSKTPHMPEHEFQRRVTDLCDWLRLTWYHVTDSRKDKSGFPDLVIVGKQDRGVVFAELKSSNGKVSMAQEKFLGDLRHAGARVYLWRPEDWPQVQNVLKGLAGEGGG